MVPIVAEVWHYWLSFALLAPILLVVVAMGVGYLVRVKASRYPRR